MLDKTAMIMYVFDVLGIVILTVDILVLVFLFVVLFRKKDK
jgi:hypothetical protein